MGFTGFSLLSQWKQNLKKKNFSPSLQVVKNDKEECDTEKVNNSEKADEESKSESGAEDGNEKEETNKENDEKENGDGECLDWFTSE